MSMMSTYLDARRQEDLARDPDWSAAQTAYDALQKALAEKKAREAGHTFGRTVDPLGGPDEYTSLQPLGGASVLVCYELDSGGEVIVTAAMIDGESVHESEFSPRCVREWTQAIAREVRKDREIAGWDSWTDYIDRKVRKDREIAGCGE